MIGKEERYLETIEPAPSTPAGKPLGEIEVTITAEMAEKLLQNTKALPLLETTASPAENPILNEEQLTGPIRLEEALLSIGTTFPAELPRIKTIEVATQREASPADPVRSDQSHYSLTIPPTPLESPFSTPSRSVLSEFTFGASALSSLERLGWASLLEKTSGTPAPENPELLLSSEIQPPSSNAHQTLAPLLTKSLLKLTTTYPSSLDAKPLDPTSPLEEINQTATQANSPSPLAPPRAPRVPSFHLTNSVLNLTTTYPSTLPAVERPLFSPPSEKPSQPTPSALQEEATPSSRSSSIKPSPIVIRLTKSALSLATTYPAPLPTPAKNPTPPTQPNNAPSTSTCSTTTSLSTNLSPATTITESAAPSSSPSQPLEQPSEADPQLTVEPVLDAASSETAPSSSPSPTESESLPPSLFRSRIFAALIDITIACSFFVLGLLFFPDPPRIIPFVLGALYLLTKDSLNFLNGQSIGKKLLNLQVVNRSNHSLKGNYKAGLLRNLSWFIAPIEFAILYVREDETNRGLRLGDDWAKTHIIPAPKARS